MAQPTATQTDLAAIEATIQTYFDGLYEGDTDKLGAAFHPLAHLYSVGPDGTAVDLPRTEWFELIRNRPSAASKGDARDDRIVSIDQSGPGTAFVKVRCQLPPRYFTDYLSLMKVDGRWQVISKSFHTEVRDR